jgi:NADH:ubiquinone oxidoreductase subunit 5 (subunit L)/multisubunit Na+/H+ antiporter MnhA subunit
MEHTITAQLKLPVEEAAGHLPGWLVPALSIGVVLVGGLIGFLMYIRRSISAPRLVADNALVGGLYKFFWNRWFIDGFYNKVVVGGLNKIAEVVAFGIEDNFDTAVHRKLPTLFTEKAYALVRQLRTENNAMVVTVSYVFVFFLFFLIVFLMVSGG